MISVKVTTDGVPLVPFMERLQIAIKRFIAGYTSIPERDIEVNWCFGTAPQARNLSVALEVQGTTQETLGTRLLQLLTGNRVLPESVRDVSVTVNGVTNRL
ncbi:hypothetical protein A2716_04990 [candidate division WWE3 bacterium RIFCSPHIGHO2_01_FULL_40_23]|uniref:Uncharacterized protein n=1 Tax=candidate division WWE3 bacterium RIFCSPLOWO2_01_FULL_41_18 TaxID=1802625 RepID=A0A1F4VD75_UNCKA|nr:MAG: hypothetical protein A2716_04990 [candidate division WWE3 bacterium RIFCSPHIGHO2_01_FULL_40_23]OGC55226.1 MAG: hypothetical protein A3A78_04600 [candidate division WWE3 bacterium RIFCSPLOWO2_01_FULL_41_18]